MPIVSRQLGQIRPRRDGSVQVRGFGIDHLGRRWPFGPRRLRLQDDVQAFVAVQVDIDVANLAFRQARKAKDAAGMAAALADVQALNLTMVGPRADLIAAASAEAQALLDAQGWTSQLMDFEENDAVEFISRGGDPDDFVRVDLTVKQYRRRLANRLWRSGLTENKRFICSLAPWVASFRVGQIANALGISTARATVLRDRCTTLRDVVCPAMGADDALIDLKAE